MFIRYVLNLKFERKANMEFEFDKFINDIEKRQNKENKRKVNRDNSLDVELDIARRLRSSQYHERWQNLIKWENR